MKPLISCLCVTHNKPQMLRRAIECFINQTYKNKQLVIVYEDFDEPVNSFLEQSKFESNIKLVKIISSNWKKTLGELRNISVENADGDFVCQWDDDDWYSPERLEVQMSYIVKTDKLASLLSRWTVFDSISRKAYISNERLWEGSILCNKIIIQQKKYPSLNKGEDTSVIEYLNQNNQLVIVDDKPSIYVYHYHGDNTWDAQHFNKIFEFSTELDPISTQKICDAIKL